MASEISVDTISTTAGGTNVPNLGGGQVMEVVAGICDGETINVTSGSYTLQNVTADFSLTDSYQDLTGSVLTYTPPAGATRVIYEFNWQSKTPSTRTLYHVKLMIAGTTVNLSKISIGDGSSVTGVVQNYHTYRRIIPIGGTASTDTGRQSSWASGKELKLQVRRYSSSYTATMHTTNHTDGGGSDSLVNPSLSITAIR